MKKLNLNKMEKVQGGSIFGCIANAGSAGTVLWGTAAAIAFGSNPVGWAVIAAGAVFTAAAWADNPDACSEL